MIAQIHVLESYILQWKFYQFYTNEDYLEPERKNKRKWKLKKRYKYWVWNIFLCGFCSFTSLSVNDLSQLFVWRVFDKILWYISFFITPSAIKGEIRRPPFTELGLSVLQECYPLHNITHCIIFMDGTWRRTDNQVHRQKCAKKCLQNYWKNIILSSTYMTYRSNITGIECVIRYKIFTFALKYIE